MNTIVELTRKLCGIYECAGYKKFKMRKFEEYSLYLDNKDFLTSEYVITFNDLSGKLLALKPDVTLSIIKNTKAERNSREKLYYTESVYRLESKTHEYREIEQVGLEVMGDIDLTQTIEVITLALCSLECMGKAFTLDISHMGIINSIVSDVPVSVRAAVLECLKTKNTHDLLRICGQNSIADSVFEKLKTLITLGSDFCQGIKTLKTICADDTAIAELEGIYQGLEALSLENNISLDFSIINDGEFYNGVVFRGFLSGVHRHVLSGGRYDKLADKFKSGIGAMGFAVYLTDLAAFMQRAEYDCDILLLYKPSDSAADVLNTAKRLKSDGARVRIEKSVPENIRYKEIREVGKC